MTRRLTLLLAVLLALLALAPGLAFADAQGRVGASLSAAPDNARPDATRSPCTRPGSIAGSARIAAGCCVAPKVGASALEDASQAAFKAADGPINISRKHLPGAGGRYSKFAEGVDVDGVVREGLRSPNAMFRPNPGGGFRVDTNFGRAIGQGGRTTLRSVVSPDGRVITAFPYGPKSP